MKRSEMHYKIWSELDRYPNISTFEAANFILALILHEGMLPPGIIEKSHVCRDNGEIIYDCNEWEPE